MKPRLLQLGQVDIANPVTGAELRNYYLLRELSAAMDVTHLGLSDTGAPLRAEYSEGKIRIKAVAKDRAYTLGKLVRGAMGRTPAMLLNFECEAMKEALTEELSATQYDIIQLEGVEVSPYLSLVRRVRRPPKFIVLDWHGIESEALMRHSSLTASILRRIYMRRAAAQLRKIERGLLDSCDLHLTVSERDRDELLTMQPTARVSAIENGVDVSRFDSLFHSGRSAEAWSERNRLLFVGNLDYSANVDAVNYFATEIWPRVRQQLPRITLTIAGRNPPPKIKALGANPAIDVTGTFPDVRPYYASAFASIVPLRVGCGTRLKILESMAAGVPVVSTSIGAEGLEAVPGVHLNIADSPFEFGEQVIRLRNDLEWSHKISSAARALAERVYDWRVIGARLVEEYAARSAAHRSAGHRRTTALAANSACGRTNSLAAWEPAIR
jgi:glycosyltransferase involved in cell wall biosynthesis